LARRALTALASEIEDRKAALAAAGRSSFRDWEAAGGAPPRLLVVVDEYQELVAHYREFLPDLARLAAQGRSLGLHLVLATQRPAGAVTPEVRANVSTTIALRVASEAESRDLIGTADAALLPLDAPGRAIVAAGVERTEIQVAVPCLRPTPAVRLWGENDPSDGASELADEVVTRRSGEQRPAPLWLPPLPADLGVDVPADARPRTGAGVVWLGRGDVPTERRQPYLFWDLRSGPLVIAGPPRSGRTSALRLVALQARAAGFQPVWLPADPREAARTIAVASRLPQVLLLVDDAPRALSVLADVDRGAPVDALMSLLESGSSVALSMPLSGPQRIASHATTRLVLSGGDPVDEGAWSVPRALQGIAPAAGRGRLWQAGRWCECQTGRSERLECEPLVRPLPTTLDCTELADSAGGGSGEHGSSEGGVPVGVGGDDAHAVSIDPRRPIAVVGPPGVAREATATWLRAAATRAKRNLEILESDTPFTLGPLASKATLVVAEPSPRTARDAFRGDTDGLVDPRPPIGRVLLVAEGTAIAVQLARP
jgi:S-DNA-T family DNA segregation ATPase FtsK/SpoIIIE